MHLEVNNKSAFLPLHSSIIFCLALSNLFPTIFSEVQLSTTLFYSSCLHRKLSIHTTANGNMASKSAAFWEKRSKSEGLRPLPCVTAHVQASYVQGSPVGSHRVGETAPAAKTLPFPNGNTIPVRPTYASIEASSVSHETAKKSAPSAKTVGVRRLNQTIRPNLKRHIDHKQWR